VISRTSGSTPAKEISMAETTEKAKRAKAPAKPRAAAATKKTDTKKPIATKQKQTVAEKVAATTPTHHEIAQLARKYWAERGHHDGQAEQDWLRAEQELLKLAS
jgi:hypothetical protein